jgi:tetratricopeptide (TPR) repeat protein
MSMKKPLLTAVLVASAVVFAAAQQPSPPSSSKPQQRDLKYEKVEDTPEPTLPEVKRQSIPRSYAIVIGVAQYKNLPASSQLKFPERDAEQIYGILISPEGGNFRAENVRKLIGPKATLSAIRDQIGAWLPAAAKEDDRVLIYFAGHGFVFNGKAYLAPYDIDPDDITRTGYPMDELSQIIGSRVKAKWKVLVTDSCHSGAITPATNAAAMNARLQGVAPSLFSLTASRDRELSYESPDWGGGHGVFTYYVVQGMQGEADADGNGIVTADELGEYVRREVRRATNSAQNPTFERASFDNNMPLSYPPSHTVSAAALPKPKTGTLIFESNMDGVEVFVNGVSQGVAGKGAPLRVPGLNPGSVTVQGVKMGYEPDGPRDERVYPGQDTTVTIKILIARRRKAGVEQFFNRGLQELNKGGAEHYRKAAEQFQRALDLDPTDSRSALYLARVYHALADEAAARRYFEKALSIDPDFVEARANFGGMLLDIGDLDESIRQLNRALTRDASNAKAYEYLSQALFRKALDGTDDQKKTMLADSVEAARKAIALDKAVAEPRLWLAESLRNQGEYKGSVDSYQAYLRLSDFDSGVAGQVNYYVLGYLIGMGKKKRAAETDIWREMRSMAYFGLCDSYRRLKDFDAAIFSCRRAIAFDPNAPMPHYLMGLAYHMKAAAGNPLENLNAARQQYTAMITLNPDLEEAATARRNLANVEQNLKVLEKQ